jgi:hypothetical protein
VSFPSVEKGRSAYIVSQGSAFPNPERCETRHPAERRPLWALDSEGRISLLMTTKKTAPGNVKNLQEWLLFYPRA